MVSIAFLPKNLMKEIRGPVDHQMLVGKIARRIDATQELDDPEPIKGPLLLVHGVEDLHRTVLGRFVTLFNRQILPQHPF